MGQYYIAVNIDKKQYMRFDWSKLMEFSWIGNQTVNELTARMRYHWQGDRVYVVGDYADSKRLEIADDAWLPAYNEAAKELGFYGKKEECNGIEREEHLQEFVYNNFEDVSGEKPDKILAAMGAELRFIINDALGVYIDLEHCPAESLHSGKQPEDIYRVHPLTLLLAMGNNRGGGDFKGYSRDLDGKLKKPRRVTYAKNTAYPYTIAHAATGQWTSTSRSIRFAKASEREQLQGLREWRPDFSEVKNPVPWEEVAHHLEKTRKERKAENVYCPRPDFGFV